MYNEYEIRPIPLSVGHCRKMVEEFLAANSLRLEAVDYYACVFRLGNDEEILAGGGLKGNVIKCVAVGQELRDEGFSSRLISHLMSEAQAHGYHSTKVFTKPENIDIFESMGFHTIARARHAILLENGKALADYCKYLSSLRKDGLTGAIIMNANPFTRGHQYLISQAARRVDWLYVIVVKEESTLQPFSFTYNERKAMIETGTKEMENITVVEGSSFQISSVTFPTYFLKHIDEATDTQITLDLDIFTNHIAKHLGVSMRFVGSEPADPLTCRYNQIMSELLPQKGIEVVEIERLSDPEPVSASLVRKHLANHSLAKASQLVPETTLPYLLARLATDALQQELDLTPKPGLVDKEDNGAHQDMNYAMMCKSIATLRPYFVRMALLNTSEPDFINNLKQTGIEAEEAMLQATGVVNTHRGAIFAMGITIAAMTDCGEKALSDVISRIASALHNSHSTTSEKPSHGTIVREKYGVGGAMAQALSGYKDLFQSWLPFYRANKQSPKAAHLTLLHIMSEIEDTNIYYRTDENGNKYVQEASRALLSNYSDYAMQRLNKEFVSKGISPGGAADMLALTLFVDSLV